MEIALSPVAAVDRRTLVMGRYAMFSVKWNFGRMNPAKNARVQNAMYNML